MVDSQVQPRAGSGAQITIIPRSTAEAASARLRDLWRDQRNLRARGNGAGIMHGTAVSSQNSDIHLFAAILRDADHPAGLKRDVAQALAGAAPVTGSVQPVAAVIWRRGVVHGMRFDKREFTEDHGARFPS